MVNHSQLAVLSSRLSRSGSNRTILDQLRTENGELKTSSQLFKACVLVSIDAHFARNLHGFFRDLAGRELSVIGKSLGRRLGIRTATTNRRNPGVGLNHVALPTEQNCLIFVADQQYRYEMPKVL